MAEPPKILEAAKAALERWKQATEAGRRFVDDYDRETTPYRTREGPWQVDARHQATAVWWRFTFTAAGDRMALRTMEKVEITRTQV